MGNRKKILLSEDSPEFRAACQEELKKRGFDVILRQRDGFEVLSAVQNELPDLVVMDAQMRNIDAIGILSALRSSPRPIRYIITSSFSNAFTEKTISETPGCVCLLRPVDARVLADRAEAVLRDGDPEQRLLKQQQLEIIVTDILHQIGVPAHIKGYHYLRRAILLTLEDMKIINSVTKQLYPAVAADFETTPSRVERAIRHAIEVAWDRGDVEVLNSYFGYTIQNNHGKPTNSEFIAMIADRIRLQQPAHTDPMKRKSY